MRVKLLSAGILGTITGHGINIHPDFIIGKEYYIILWDDKIISNEYTDSQDLVII